MPHSAAAAPLDLYQPGAIPPGTQLTVVSMAARGNAVHRIADATTLPIATVQHIGRHYGAPDLAALALAAAELRAFLEDETGADAAPAPEPQGRVTLGVLGIPAALLELRQEAEKLGAAQLVKRLDWIKAHLDVVQDDLSRARKLKATSDRARARKLKQLAEIRAEVAERTAELATTAEQIRALEAELNKLTPDERVRCRAWASEHLKWEADRGRIPQRIVTAWTEAGRP